MQRPFSLTERFEAFMIAVHNDKRNSRMEREESSTYKAKHEEERDELYNWIKREIIIQKIYTPR